MREMSKVAIIQGDAYHATVNALQLTNFKDKLKGKSKIVIKPNLVVKLLNLHSSLIIEVKK